MSFAERLAGLMARPGADNVPRDDVPWHLKYGGRAVGIVGGFLYVYVRNKMGLVTEARAGGNYRRWPNMGRLRWTCAEKVTKSWLCD
ncbi:conserved hypothetical protein [Culex quinquefasciatus]|uniref:Uncharacterized protein n=1 Tax=Culex quinquefasciatus TaxID=7176 RepID=B0W2I3_CULQU|nr:conserved hypothetical protein [Culex quinquefasciatus]|eukprot:XP_001842902.1 conserved hypothetical protein [Culex quinquefasciatus]